MLLRFFKVESAVIEMIIVNVRGEGTVVAGRAYLSTFFAVPHFHFMTAFQTQPKKGTGFSVSKQTQAAKSDSYNASLQSLHFLFYFQYAA